ncbi:MAG: exodeoxyribonuclease III [Beijerinckiaceae bacterium]
MALKVTTWNINSVRLRIGLVARFVAEQAPDVLCLQETKCPDEQLPLANFRAMGFPHFVTRGQKGYNGVAILSRFPLEAVGHEPFGGGDDARHISARLGAAAGAAAGITVHNLYIPSGGDIADPEANAKFAHKLRFLDDLTRWAEGGMVDRRANVLVGDLNIAPYEHDVWSHKALLDVVSHTPVETAGLEHLRGAGRWTDAVRKLKPEPEKVYSWWSYRAADWSAADKGRRLDHVWTTEDLAPAIGAVHVSREVRGWEKPSDHAPVTVTLAL